MMAQKIAQKMHFIIQKPFQFFSSLEVDGQSVSFSAKFVLFVRFSPVFVLVVFYRIVNIFPSEHQDYIFDFRKFLDL